MLRIIFFIPWIIILGTSCTAEPQTQPQEKKGTILLVQDSADYILISKAGSPILHYQKSMVSPPDEMPDHYQRSGFIYPVYTPNGVIVTDDFPVGHAHQHSFFHAWTKTTLEGEKVDFWNQHKALGDVKHKEVLNLFSTDSTAGFKVLLDHISLKHGNVLTEEWTITAFERTDYNLWEIDLTQENIYTDTLFIDDYHYGGLGFRGSKHWNSDDSTAFQNPMLTITSEGLERDSANHSRPEWACAYGEVNNQPVGFVMLDHPDNFRYPQAIRVHPEMPYFCKAPMVGQAFFIAPGEKYQAKYRIITFDGQPDEKAITKEQKRFAGRFD